MKIVWKISAGERLKRIMSVLYLPVSVVYLELVLRSASHMKTFHSGTAGALLTALCFALASEAVCSLFKGKSRSVVRAVFLEIAVLWFLIAYFLEDTYKVFMELPIVLSTAGDAVGDFGGNIINVFVGGFPRILQFHVPTIIYLLLEKSLFRTDSGRRMKRAGAMLLSAAVCFFAGYYASVCTPTLSARYFDEYTYDNAIRNYGLLSALVQKAGNSSSDGSDFTISEQTPLLTAEPASPAVEPVENPSESGEETAEPEEKIEYGKNVMELDLSGVNPKGIDSIEALCSYIENTPPTSKNEYTGLFEGKNLILITAEAFSKEVIDPERTPTLYRLANNGIVFEDFYQPAWGGSTSTGEYSWLTGLVPTNPSAMAYSIGENMYFTMGNQLQRQGYFSRAYHNGTSTYYDRDKTHPNLGYSEFIASGSGMEAGLSSGFPKSDLEMIDFTVPQYIDKQPFSVYYMTLSGHANYMLDEDINAMSAKNSDFTEGMPYSEPVRAYYACNQELEYALASLVRQLEEAGIAENTVIALVTDHYPYGLMPSAAWGTKNSYLAELYGFEPETDRQRDHSAAIIWCADMEDGEPIVVSGPTYSLDILPTLSNLFGLEFDSRLMVGRDVLSDAQRLVLWPDYSWLTDAGYYDSHTMQFTSSDGSEVSGEYIEYMKNEVKNRITLSRVIIDNGFYTDLFGEDTVK